MSRQERETFCRGICNDLTAIYHSRCRYKIYPMKDDKQSVAFWFDSFKVRVTFDDMGPLVAEIENPSRFVEETFIQLFGEKLQAYKRYWEAMDQVVHEVCNMVSNHFQAEVIYKYINFSDGELLQVAMRGNRRILQIPIHELNIKELFDVLCRGFGERLTK